MVGPFQLSFDTAFNNVNSFVPSPRPHNSDFPVSPSTPPLGPRVPPPQSTPVKFDSSTTLPFTTNAKYGTTGGNVRGREMSKYIIKPIPTKIFLDTFFPVNELSNLDAVPKFEPNCYHNIVNLPNEQNMYIPFVSEHLGNVFICLSQVLL